MIIYWSNECYINFGEQWLEKDSTETEILVFLLALSYVSVVSVLVVYLESSVKIKIVMTGVLSQMTS